MRHAVIMAGGVGSRLWPKSRQATPKQFQKLIGDKTLIQQTFERIKKVLPAENIWVQTAQSYTNLVAQQLPEINAKHIISEPSARNTAPATLLATLTVIEEDPQAVLFGIVPADHFIGKEDVFVDASSKALTFIEDNPQFIATIGIHPTEPNTGLGYIKKGERLSKAEEPEIFQVASFVEKPDLATAEKFVLSGDYLWNGGYYLFNGEQIKKYYQQLLPETSKKLQKFVTNPSEHSLYEGAESISFDKAISEKINKLAVIPADMKWNDIGNWAAIHDILSEQGQNNEVVVGKHIGHANENTLVMSNGKLIATVGLKDVVVIDTDDVLLVCNKNNAQNVKDIVDQLKSTDQTKYL